MGENLVTLKAEPEASLSAGRLTLYAFGMDEQPVGCVELYNYDPINLRAAVGIVVDEAYRHKGFGIAILQALTQFCRENTHLHQVYADVAATNHASLRLFTRVGYRQCATFRDWVRVADRYVDTLRFQLLLRC